jgi:predicted HTH transcriptional regulator
MTPEELKNIIKNGENAKVDFKREWYKKEDLKGEFIKDMLALTNGDVHSIDKTAYLIIGITDNTKEFYDFDSSSIKNLGRFKKQLLDILNGYSQPEFTSLDIEWVEFGNGDVLVLSIPPRGRLLSLSKDLILKEEEKDEKIKIKRDRKGTVYYRVGESVKVASADIIRDFEKAFEKDNSKGGVTINVKGDIKGIGSVTGGEVNQTLNFN